MSRWRVSGSSVGIGTNIIPMRLPKVASLLLATDRHRNHGHERVIGEVVVSGSQAAHGSGRQGDHYIVDCDAQGVVDRLDASKGNVPKA